MTIFQKLLKQPLISIIFWGNKSLTPSVISDQESKHFFKYIRQKDVYRIRLTYFLETSRNSIIYQKKSCNSIILTNIYKTEGIYKYFSAWRSFYVKVESQVSNNFAMHKYLKCSIVTISVSKSLSFL